MIQKEFGDYVKELRKSKGKTLQELATALKVSLSLLCDIENKRRSLDEEKMETLANFLLLTKEEKNKLYDLDAQRRQSVPNDVKEVIMFNDASDFVRIALRKTKSGELSKEDWQKFTERHEEGHRILHDKKESDIDDKNT